LLIDLPPQKKRKLFLGEKEERRRRLYGSVCISPNKIASMVFRELWEVLGVLREVLGSKRKYSQYVQRCFHFRYLSFGLSW
jgi:hypothetical protein